MTNKKVEMKWHRSDHTGGIEVFGYFLDLALSSDKPIKDEEKDDVD